MSRFAGFILLLIATAAVAQDACTLRLEQPQAATIYYSDVCYVQPHIMPGMQTNTIYLVDPVVLGTDSSNNWQEQGSSNTNAQIGSDFYSGVVNVDSDWTFVFTATDVIFESGFE